MATPDDLDRAWDRLAATVPDRVIPVTYINSAATLKAFVARRGGTVCTSSNARAVLQWAYSRGDKVFFFPDEHLGRITAFELGVPLSDMANGGSGLLFPEARQVSGAWLLGGVLLAVLGLTALRPRFFCRTLCPAGALLGLATRFVPWRIGKSRAGSCGTCHLCEEYCEGGCAPSGEFTVAECVLCGNCLDRCPTGRIGFAGRPSVAGERALPDLSRRGAVVAVAAGALAVPLWRVGGLAGTGRNPSLIRPPGALDEDHFLARCLRCGLCMATRAAKVGVWEYRKDTNTYYVDPSFQELLGASDDTGQISLDAWMERVHPEDRERVREALTACLDGEQDEYVGEQRMQH